MRPGRYLPTQSARRFYPLESTFKSPLPKKVDPCAPRPGEDTAAQKPIRVLHLVAGLNRAGTETWLVSLLPHLLAEKIHCDFMVNENKTYDLSEIVKSHGSNILVCDEFQNALAFAFRFLNLLRQNGPYDLVHFHTGWFSGFEAFLTAMHGIKNRIVHSHNDTSLIDSTAKRKRRFAIVLMDILIRHFSTGGLATSEKAGKTFLRRRWRSSPRWKIHLSTSDIAKFSPREPEALLRANLSIPEGALVIGHVGRFAAQKNHEFLLRSFSELLKLKPRSFLVCIGDGPYKPAIAALAKQLEIQDKARLLPATNEVYRYVAGLFDVFVLPSLYEGLGIVAVEAQAAGIPVILSDRIPSEAHLISELVTVLSLDESPSKWALAMATTQPLASIQDRTAWFQEVIKSDFEPGSNAKTLASYYRAVCEE